MDDWRERMAQQERLAMRIIFGGLVGLSVVMLVLMYLQMQ